MKTIICTTPIDHLEGCPDLIENYEKEEYEKRQQARQKKEK